jgi:hypothetical protein
MYQKLKAQFLCAEVGWDEETILAPLTDVDCGDHVAAAPAMPATQSDFPSVPASCPLPTIPVLNVNSPLSSTNAVLTASSQDGQDVAGHIGDASRNEVAHEALYPIGSSLARNVNGGGRVD